MKVVTDGNTRWVGCINIHIVYQNIVCASFNYSFPVVVEQNSSCCHGRHTVLKCNVVCSFCKSPTCKSPTLHRHKFLLLFSFFILHLMCRLDAVREVLVIMQSFHSVSHQPYIGTRFYFCLVFYPAVNVCYLPLCRLGVAREVLVIMQSSHQPYISTRKDVREDEQEVHSIIVVS